MTRSLASELGEFNINVNAVAPGLVETRMPQQHATNASSSPGFTFQSPELNTFK